MVRGLWALGGRKNSGNRVLRQTEGVSAVVQDNGSEERVSSTGCGPMDVTGVKAEEDTCLNPALH